MSKSIKNIKIQKTFDVTSLNLDLSGELIYAESTFFRTTLYKVSERWEDFSRYLRSHPLIGYSFKRLVYGVLTLILSIAIIFFLVNFVTDDSSYMPTSDQLGKMGIQIDTPAYDRLLESRLILFGVSGNAFERLLNYFYNIIPFIPKKILVGTGVEFPHLGLDPIVQSVLYSGGRIDALYVTYPELREQLDSIRVISEYKTVWVYLGIVKSNSLGTPGVSEVNSLFVGAIPYSFAFGSVAVVISYFIGVPLGIEAAKRKGKKADGAINGGATFLLAIPAIVIVIGVFLASIMFFGHSSMFSSGSFWTKFWPVIALVIMITPTIIILTRRYVVDEMTSDYTKFAYSKGLSENKVFYIHIFRNAGIRILREFPLDIAFTLFGASILTETQWNIPGMSQLIVSAVRNRDSFVILGFISFASLVKIIATLISDLFMVWMDPRINLSGK